MTASSAEEMSEMSLAIARGVMSQIRASPAKLRYSSQGIKMEMARAHKVGFCYFHVSLLYSAKFKTGRTKFTSHILSVNCTAAANSRGRII